LLGEVNMMRLQQRDAERRAARELSRQGARERLAAALHELLPGQPVILFGSITQPGAFGPGSDVDIALQKVAERLKPLINAFAAALAEQEGLQ
jgi:hypothetical protein